MIITKYELVVCTNFQEKAIENANRIIKDLESKGKVLDGCDIHRINSAMGVSVLSIPTYIKIITKFD